MTELPLQPPAETPPPVLMRPAIEAAWRAELAATMASMHPPVNDEMAPTEPTRPLRNAVGSEPTPPSVRAALFGTALPISGVAEPEPEPEPMMAIEPVVDLRPRGARAGVALAMLAVVAVAIGAGVAFFRSDVEVDMEPQPAQVPSEVAKSPAPVVTALEPEPAPEPEPERAAKPAPERTAKPKPKPKPEPERKAKPKPEPEPDPAFVERIVDEPGFFTVDAHPYATVYIDGERVGDTPLIRHTLSAGKHRVKLVSSDGGTKRFVVRIEPGTTLRRRVGAME